MPLYIIRNGSKQIASWKDISLKGKDITCIQAKRGRLGMYLMGQALFSRDLLAKFEPSSIQSIALCTEDDDVLRPILERHGIQVVIDSGDTSISGLNP